MSWTYKHKKRRDKIRAQFAEETGLSIEDKSEFEAWLRAKGLFDS